MTSFQSLYPHDFARIASCVPRTRVAMFRPISPRPSVLRGRATRVKAALMIFPELGLSAYAIDDLLFQDALLAGSSGRSSRSSRLPRSLPGADRRRAAAARAALQLRGRDPSRTLLGVVPKTYLPNYREFYEKRQFASGAGMRGAQIAVAGTAFRSAPICCSGRPDRSAVTFHVEICEDVWAPLPPSTTAALAGAEVLVNLSASNITIGKAETRRLLCARQSARAIAAYAYSAAGPGESTTDLAWDGHAAIYECGDRLAETERFAAAIRR